MQRRIYEIDEEGRIKRDRTAEFFERHPWTIYPILILIIIISSIQV